MRWEDSLAGYKESREMCTTCTLPGLSLARQYQLLGTPESLNSGITHSLKCLYGAHRSHDTNQVLRSNNEEWRPTTWNERKWECTQLLLSSSHCCHVGTLTLSSLDWLILHRSQKSLQMGISDLNAINFEDL